MAADPATFDDDVVDALAQQLQGRLNRKRLIELAIQAQRLQQRLALHGPQNRDELHAWIVENLHLNIPRVAVCEDHESPFEFLARAFFEESTNITAIANRGGSKTFIVALLHLLNSKFKPSTDSLTVGAVENQARRCYIHLGKLIDTLDPKHKELTKDPTQTMTNWSNGSSVEILPGTINAVNGPHPQKLHLDEVELMDPEVLDESFNMPQAKTLQSGRVVEAQIIRTSTRKRAAGMMQQIVNEVFEAKRDGNKLPTDLLYWCIFETAQQVPNCQVANPELQGCDACQCHDVVKGEWDDGTPRTLRDVCQGRLARSSGWITYNNIITTFQSVSRHIWEAQQECRRPSTQGLVVPQFTRERHGLKNYEPDPDNGPIFMSIDFGGTNPHGVGWYQLVKYELVGKNLNNYDVRIPEGSVVCFDEIYRSEIGNGKLADLIIDREKHWRSRYPTFKVLHRFYDVQSRVGKLDFGAHKPPLNLQNFVPKDVLEEVKVCVEFVSDGKFFVDLNRCPNFVDEVESWHYPKQKPGMVDDPDKPVDDFDHMMSSWRYLMTNLRHVIKMAGRGQKRAPKAGKTGHLTTVPRTSATTKRTEQIERLSVRPIGRGQ